MANQNYSVGIGLSFKADTSYAKKQIDELKRSIGDLTSKSNLSKLPLTEDIVKATGEAKRLEVALHNATNLKTGGLDLTLFQKELKSASLNADQVANSLLSLGPNGTQSFMQLARGIASSNTELRKGNTILNQFATTLKNSIKWQLSSSLIHGFVGSIQKAYGYAQDLNKSLNNIRIVSGASSDDMARFAKEANAAAKELSTTTTAVTDASLIFYQQGLKGQDVTDRTETVLKLSNVTGQSAEEVSSYMTAIWNNFDDGSESLEHYADVITNLGAHTASSSAEIAEGLEKFASIGQTVGLSYEYATTALATVVAQTRQSADTVGTSFKTLFARLQGLKLGETLEDGTDLNKYSQALASIGVNIKDANGEMKDMDRILDEMGAKWSTLGKDTQIAVAQAVAGTRQYSQIMALMSNWDVFQENLQFANNSDGTLQKQADIYAESWEAARKKVQASMQGIYSSVIEDEFFIDLTNEFAKLLESIQKFTDGIGGLKGLIPIVSTMLFSMFGKDLANSIDNIILNFKILTGQVSTAALTYKQEFLNSLKSNLDDSTLADSFRAQLNLSDQILEKRKQLKKLGIELTEEEENRISKQEEFLALIGEEVAKRREAAQQTIQNSEQTFTDLNKNNGWATSSASVTGAEGASFQTDLERLDVGNRAAYFKSLEAEKSIQEQLIKQLEDKQNNNEKLTKQEEADLANAKNRVDAINKERQAYRDLIQEIEKYLNVKGKHGLVDSGKVTDAISTAGSDLKQAKSQNTIFSQMSKTIGGMDPKDFNAQEKYLKQTVDSINKNSTIFGDNNNAAVKDFLNKVNDEFTTTEEKVKALNAALKATEQDAQAAADKLNGIGLGATVQNATQEAENLGNAILNDASAANQLTIAFDEAAAEVQAMGIISVSAGQAFTSAAGALSSLAMGWKGLQALSDPKGDFVSRVMALTMVLSSLKQLSGQLGTFIKPLHQYFTIVQAGTPVLITQLGLTKEQRREIRKLATVEEMEAYAKKKNIVLSKESIAAILAEKKAYAALRTTALSAIAVIGATAAIGLIGYAVSQFKEAAEREEEARKATIEANRERIEANKEIIKEAENTEKLYKNYADLNKQYKEHVITKAQLINDTKELADSFEDEDIKIFALTQNYEAYTQAIENARLERLKEAKEAAEENRQLAKFNYETQFGDDNFTVDFAILDDTTDAKTQNIFKDVFGDTYKDGKIHLDFDNNLEESIKAYEDYYSFLDSEEFHNFNSDQKAAYRSYKDKLDLYKDYVAELKSTYNEEADAVAKYEGANLKLDKVNMPYDEFEKNADALKAKLEEDYSPDKAAEVMSAYMDSLGTTYSLKYNAIQKLLSKENLADEVKEQLENLSLEELSLILSGQVKIDYIQTKEELENALHNAAQYIKGTVDVTDLVSYEDALVSGKTNKKDAKEHLENLNGNYDIEMAGFDNKNRIEQFEVLEDITNQEIENNRRYIENSRQAAEEDKEITETYKRNAEERRKELLDKKDQASKGLVPWTEEDSEALKQAENDILAFEATIDHYNDIIENGLDPIDVQDTLFSNLISQSDQLINKAEMFYDISQKVGEGWTVAKKDVAGFADAFPDLLAVADNYDILADGSLKFSEQGKKALQDQIDAAHEVLKTEKETQIARIDSQLQQEEASKAYLEKELENIRDYLEGKKSQADAEKGLEENLANYKAELFGGEAEDYANLIENKMTNDDASGEAGIGVINQVADGWVAASNIMAAAAKSFETGEPAPAWKPLVYQRASGGAVSRDFVASSLGEAAAKNFDESPDFYNAMLDLEARREKELSETEGRISKLTSEKAKLQSQMAETLNSLDNVKSGKGNSKSGGGGSKDKDIKNFEKEVDYLHDINRELKREENAYNRLEKEKKKYFGTAYVEVLEDEEASLNKQIELQQRKMQLHLEEAGRLQGVLSQMGVIFDEQGNIANYNDLISQKIALINQQIALARTLTGAAREEAQATLELMKEELSTLEKQMQAYEKVQDNIMDTQNALDDLEDKKYQVFLDKFTWEIKLRLDISQIKRDYIDFKKQMQELTKEDFVVSGRFDLQTMGTYLESGGDIQEYTRMIGETLNNGDIHSADKREMLKEYFSGLADALLAVKELEKEIKESYIKLIDKATDRFDKHVSQYEHINSLLEHQSNLINLVYGEGQYDMQDDYFDALQRSNLGQLDFLRQEVNYWEYLVKNLEKGSDAWVQAEEKLRETQEELNDLVEESLQNIIDQYENAVKGIIKKSQEGLTGGTSIETVKFKYDLDTRLDDAMLDPVSQLFEAQKLANKITKSMADTDNLKYQQKLADLMDYQVEALRTSSSVRQYDVDRANELYELTLKQMALEDAKANKDMLKLVRDSQGNWVYEYVANTKDLEDANNDLLDAQANLYKLDRDALKQYTSEYVDTIAEMYNEIENLALDRTLSDADRNERKAAIIKSYQELLANIEGAIGEIQPNITASGMGLLDSVSAGNEDVLNIFTPDQVQTIKSILASMNGDYITFERSIVTGWDQIKDVAGTVMSDINIFWNSSVLDMANKFYFDPDSFYHVVEDTWKQIEAKQLQWADSVKKIEQASGENFKNIGKNIKDVDDKTKALINTNAAVIGTVYAETEATFALVAAMQALLNGYSGIMDAAKRAMDAAYAYITAINDERAAHEENIKVLQEEIDKTQKLIDLKNKLKNLDNGDDNGDTGGDTTGNGKQGVWQDPDSGKWYATYGSKTSGPFGTSTEAQDAYRQLKDGGDAKDGLGNPVGTKYKVYANNGAYLTTGTYDEIKRFINNPSYKIQQAAKGLEVTSSTKSPFDMLLKGTGEDTMVAVREGERILSQEQTQSFNKLVNSILPNLMNSNIFSMLEDVGKLSPVSGPTTNTTSSTSNTYNVNADFSGVRTAAEIEEALTSIGNYASQYVWDKN